MAAIPTLSVEATDANCEGNKMSPRPQGLRLPTELLIAIADHLRRHQDIIAFGLTCKDLYTLLVKNQRRSLEINFHGSPTACTLLGAPRLRLLSQQAARLTIANVGDKLEHSRDWRGYGRLQTCSCCVPSRHMGAVKRLFSRNDSNFAKSIKELTLSGYFPYQGAEDECSSLSSHSFLHRRRFRAMRLETFEVELDWNDWDFEILYGMLWARSCASSVTNLKVLKLPISLPSDCIRLGQALHFMPRLVSLAITDIPDREEFLVYLGYLGRGILCCASTLRELNLEMTNFNRPAPWDGDERFIEPDDKGFFFRKLFPCPPGEELLALFKRQLRDGTDPITEAPFSLTKLRLKHVSLPWYSFGITFNAESIKHLHLPYSTVDEIVWQLLGLYAQLDTLTHISYDMLSAEFLGFLEEQSSLKELSFARPQDRYNTTGVTFFGASSHMMIRVSEEAPALGPDTGAGYPSLDKFLSSLRDMKMLKHLVLPMDMYTITPKCLITIAAWLIGLEHLELGFDYNDAELLENFVSYFLCCTPTLKKITFFSLADFDTVHLHALISSLGHQIPANLKLVRYMPLNQAYSHSYRTVDVYYHRETPVDGKWWIRLPSEEGEQLFAEGGTPRIVPVARWDWEVEAEKNEYRAGQ